MAGSSALKASSALGIRTVAATPIKFMAVGVDPQPLNLVIPVGDSRRTRQALCEPWTAIPVIEGRLKNMIIRDPDAPLADLIEKQRVFLPLRPQAIEPESKLACDPDLLKLLYLAYYYRDCILEARDPIGQPTSEQCDRYYCEWSVIQEQNRGVPLDERAAVIKRACSQPVTTPPTCTLL